MESKPVATEFVTTSLSSGGNKGQGTAMENIYKSNNASVQFHNTERGYILCEVTPDQWLSYYKVIDDVEKAGGKTSIRASYAVQAGNAKILKALMKLFIILFAFLSSLSATESFKVAVLADCQYCNQPDRGKRMYKTSDQRLREFVKESNKHELKFAVQLGDLIDKDYESYEPILKILEDLKTPLYHVLGNHDFSVSPQPKSAVLKLLKMPKKYYSMKVNNYRFIALDGNDLSFHAYDKGSEKYQEAEKYYKQNKVKSPKWNGALSQAQMNGWKAS